MPSLASSWSNAFRGHEPATGTMFSPILPKLSPLSLGCTTFGREINATASHEIMSHATSRGITHFDTAAAYAAGDSEKIVGDWLAANPSAKTALSIATKILPPYDPVEIDRAVAASAARLDVEMIDVLYLHRWDPAAVARETLSALDRLVRAGRVRMLGASNFTAPRLAAALALQKTLGLAPFRFLQNNHNLAVRAVDAELLALCAAHDVSIVTYSPLGAGFLTGKHRAGVQPGSRFAIVPAHQDIYFQPVAERRLAHLENIARRTRLPMSHLALAWALHRPGIAAVLVGGRTRQHIDQAFDALAFDDAAVLAELDNC